MSTFGGRGYERQTEMAQMYVTKCCPGYIGVDVCFPLQGRRVCCGRCGAFPSTTVHCNAAFSSFCSEPEPEPADSAVTFMESVLRQLGIPEYGMRKYTQVLRDHYLTRIDQLKGALTDSLLSQG